MNVLDDRPVLFSAFSNDFFVFGSFPQTHLFIFDSTNTYVEIQPSFTHYGSQTSTITHVQNLGVLDLDQNIFICYVRGRFRFLYNLTGMDPFILLQIFH